MKNKLFYGLGIGLVGYLAYKGIKEGDSQSCDAKYKGLTKLDSYSLEESLQELTNSMDCIQVKIQELKDYL